MVRGFLVHQRFRRPHLEFHGSCSHAVAADNRTTCGEMEPGGRRHGLGRMTEKSAVTPAACGMLIRNEAEHPSSLERAYETHPVGGMLGDDLHVHSRVAPEA